MNKHLQNILNFLQQDDRLSAEEKSAALKSLKDADKELEITAFKLDRTEKVKRTTAILLEETIQELEQKRKAVEEQNTELAIESSLERVRTVAMSMQTPDHLLKVAEVLFRELKQLGFSETRNALIGIFHDEKNCFTDYDYSDFSGGEIHRIPYNKNAVVDRSIKQMKSATDAFTEFVVAGKELEEWKAFRVENQEYDDTRIENSTALYYYFYSISDGNIGISTFKKITDVQLTILKRFRNVFDLAYKRYVDISNAEAQAKESQIQLALERVRARTMAMQKSEELGEISSELFKQVQSLGITSWHCAFNIYDEDQNSSTEWGTNAGGTYPIYKTPREGIFLKYYETAQTGVPLHIEVIGEDRCADHYEWLCTLPGIGEQLVKLRDSGVAFPASQVDHVAYFKYGYLIFISYQQEPWAHEIFIRFAKVFEQTYTRFLDLQKAEAQAREAKIEAALERVRSRSMAMHKSDELQDAATVLFKQLRELGGNLWTAGFVLLDAKSEVGEFRMSNPEGEIQLPISIPNTEDPATKNMYNHWKNGADYYVEEAGGNDLKKHYDYLLSLPEAKPAFQAVLDAGLAFPTWQKWHAVYFSGGYLLVITLEPFENIDMLKRFTKVFEQTYTRFLDLQKAEEQARESQIQLALERVRARTMAMQQSTELPDAANILFQQVQSLGMPAWSAGYCTWNEDKSAVTLWMSSEGVLQPPFTAPTTEDELFIQMRKGQEDGKTFHVVEMGGDKLVKHYEYMRTLPLMGDILDSIIAAGHPLPTFQIMHHAYFSKGFLLFITYEPVPDAHDIFKRFGKVFDQTYTRFLDLQKAEAQAREAQIEAALERVRSKAMAMYKSEDLHDAVAIVFQELDKLNLGVLRVGISVLNKEKRTGDVWLTSVDKDSPVQVYGNESFDFHPLMQGSMDAWIRQEDFYYILEGADLTNYYKGVEATRFGLPASQLLSSGGQHKKQSCYVAVYNSGGLFAFREGEFPQEAKTVMKRFANVFDLTYKRFLDLQKAEAQAREAQIEVALERVRAKTMAMQHSDDLPDAATLLFRQIESLGAPSWNCSFNIWTADKKYATAWNGTKDGFGRPFQTPSSEDVFFEFYEAAQREEELYIKEIGGKELEQHYNYLATLPGVGITLAELKEAGIVLPSFQVFYIAYFAQGYLMFITYEPVPEFADIFKRFAKVFEQTYTRFLDLKKAEAQAKEAQIESALERVRSRTLAMQKSDELAETAAVLFQQLIALGIEPNRLYISIIKGDDGETEFWITDEDGTKVSTAFATNMNDNATFFKMYGGWKQQQKSLVIDMQGDELQSYFRHLTSLGVPFKGGLEQKRRVQDIAYFSKGFIGMASPDEQPVETLQLLERFAAVFNLTFTRFNDLKIAEAHAEQAELDLIAIKEAKQKAEAALTELQATQKQLIQSEKMASLGELTAGIAHEIQNPLNFVNNFSEINKELLVELKDEINNGNLAEVNAIADDVISNEEKINQHGKRADAIVKGMLQHSRSSSSNKEPTAINALCDEYLRLSYHGLRAKDKSFNAKFETDFDTTIDNINVVPQDIGRVILNLINNAFYAVNEKKKHLSLKGEPNPVTDYEPAVIISTKKQGGKVLISVRDNGNGIPKNVVGKIFQPFFTTKPTGQGTGLGLSLSYDIIKAHGGALTVTSEQNEETIFTITLPTH